MKTVQLKRHSVQVYEGLEVTPEILQEPRQATLREFIKNVCQVELRGSDRMVIHTRTDRLAFTQGDWILKTNMDAGISFSSPGVRYMVVGPEEIKKYEPIKNQ